MWKAFFAHASEDKPFVEAVALSLSRVNVVLDKMCFKAGDAVEEAIIEGIKKSDLFVFFASKLSLSRFWPKFEINEARMRKIKALTFIIDGKTRVEELPEWMRHWVIVSPAPPPIQTARLIKMRLFSDAGLDKQLPFVGREDDLKRFGLRLIKPPEQVNPRIVVISGLDGVGRRTFAKRAVKDYLSLEIGLTTVLEETDSLDKLYWSLVEENSESVSRDMMAKKMGEFRAMSLRDQAGEVARHISQICQSNLTPVVVDRGVLLDDSGNYSEQMVAILEELLNYKNAYLVLIHRRRPEMPEDEDIKQGIAFYRLIPLSLGDIELLLQQVLRTSGVTATSPQIRNLATFMEGYPPSVNLACQYAQEYGLTTLLGDKAMLVSIQVRTFLPILKRFKISEQEWEILRILVSENALPLEAIAMIIDKKEEEIVPLIKHLIDLNTVIRIDTDFSVSPPIREAVIRLRGSLEDTEYKAISEKLLAKYWTNNTDIPSLSIVDMTIHALSFGDIRKLKDFSDIILPSQLLRAAKEAYDTQNWDRAIEFAKRTLKLDRESKLARVILFKAYVRKELWQEAEEELSTIRDKGLKAYFYLAGFLEWKIGNLQKAVTNFKSALKAGDTSVSVYRDLSHCLFRLGESGEATNTLNSAPGWIFRNPYVVDLAAQIAIAQRDITKAKRYISTLEYIADSEIFHLRQSMLKQAQGDLDGALEDARAAYQGDKVSFQAMSQKADILIEMQDYPNADKAIDELKPPNSMKRDVKAGLKCKLLLRQKLWRETEFQFNNIHNRDSAVSRMLRKEILEQKIADLKVDEGERQTAVEELKKLGKLLNLPIVMDDEGYD